jgi:hypothetical protein
MSGLVPRIRYMPSASPCTPSERLEGELREREEALGEARGKRDSAKEAGEKHRRERQSTESSLKQSEERLGRERYLRMSSERAYQVEKDWRQELHGGCMARSCVSLASAASWTTRVTCLLWCCAS